MLIGYVAGDVAVGDPVMAAWLAQQVAIAFVVPLCCAVLVVPAAHLMTQIARRRRTSA